MFTFSDLRLVIAFGTAVALLSVDWVVVRRLRPSDPAFSPRPIHKGTLVGGVLFGAGWPSRGLSPRALVQLGEGKLGALVTLVGIFAGNALYAAVHERYFRFSVGGCEG
ncbi:MAG: YeeE/YedE family protein [Sandaracinaceae bacterium]|nr:YeeE/YedE family protein [Sandaracinaceae bacterium]